MMNMDEEMVRDRKRREKEREIYGQLIVDKSDDKEEICQTINFSKQLLWSNFVKTRISKIQIDFSSLFFNTFAFFLQTVKLTFKTHQTYKIPHENVGISKWWNFGRYAVYVSAESPFYYKFNSFVNHLTTI